MLSVSKDGHAFLVVFIQITIVAVFQVVRLLMGMAIPLVATDFTGSLGSLGEVLPLDVFVGLPALLVPTLGCNCFDL
jgi:hypothetical protein